MKRFAIATLALLLGFGAAAPILAAESGTLDSSGIVRFAYGFGTPTLQCSPVHACALMLEPGETVYDTIAGDNVRWQIVKGVSGSHQSVPTFYFKPIDNGIPDTNLIVTTNRRTYNVNLQSVAFIQHELYGFVYPPTSGASTVSGAASTAAAPATAAAPPVSGAMTTSPLGDAGPSAFDYGYHTAGNDLARPVLVCNDGTRTWLLMPQGLQEAPSVYVVDPNGQHNLVAVYPNGRWYRLNGVPQKIIIITSAHQGSVQATVEHIGG